MYVVFNTKFVVISYSSNGKQIQAGSLGMAQQTVLTIFSLEESDNLPKSNSQ